MVEINRESAVRFEAVTKKTEVRDNWAVALEYADEGQGPWITDLAHKTRWDLQDSGIGQQSPCGLAVPAACGQCHLDGRTLITRMNRTQAAIYHLGLQAPQLPDFSGYTDVSEATVFLAIFGPGAFDLAEKLTDLDLTDPAQTPPFLLQGPFCRVPCQIVVMERTANGGGGFLLTCSRGYGASLVTALMNAGGRFGPRPAGEARFIRWAGELER
jgi:hypothetical protein